MYDVIVIGARVAGAPTAMLLAQKGYKVLLVDRASFPSDTLSTHQVQLRGGAMLKRWGLLDKVLASNCPPARRVAFHTDQVTIHGSYFPLDGVDGVVSPRRTVLDKILVDAAVEAGAELRQDFLVEELTQADGRVTGLRGRVKSGGDQIEETAHLVIGADGKHSLVAKTVQAPEYNQKPALSCAYYTYWEGLNMDGGEIFSLPRGAMGIWPTNDGKAMIFNAFPIAEFAAVRQDIEGQVWKRIESLPGLADRFRSGRQAERFYGSADLPAFYRRPYGPGWALVGDAGMTLDPVTGQGIGNAFQDAARLAEAVDAWLSGKMSVGAAMAVYERRRNADTQPIYEFTAQLAAFAPPSVMQRALFSALAEKPEAASRFFGVLSGSVPLAEFFKPGNLVNILGIKGIRQILLGGKTPGQHRERPQAVHPGTSKGVIG